MLVSDLVTNARRILGDTAKERWSDERMLDIINSGLKDINKFVGAYRSEHIIEVMDYCTRYPLPLDVQQVTSIWYDGEMFPVLERGTKNPSAYAIKDQVNVGVLEVVGLAATKSSEPRFYSGTVFGDSSASASDTLTVPTDPIEGTASDLLSDLTGVTSDIVISTDLLVDTPESNYGILSDIMVKGTEVSLSSADSSSFGVLTTLTINSAPVTSDNAGSIAAANAPIRIIGRYGTVTSALTKDEYLHIFYKALPTRLTSLDMEFPMSPKFEEMMINWVVGKALSDDNDAGNNARGDKFMSWYMRELMKEHKDSSKNYSSAPSKQRTTYNGGIIKKR